MHCRRRAHLILVALSGAVLVPTTTAGQDTQNSELRLGAVTFEGSNWREALAYRVGETSEMEQTFVAPDGARSRLRHETDYVQADTMVTRSYDRDESAVEWTPRRTYTWVRRAGDPRELCPGLARGDA